MNTRTIFVAGITASLLAAPAFAHHSFAMFDASKTVSLDGTVKSFEWTNPHMWLTLMVEQPNGEAAEYPLEMQGIAGAVRQGWTRDAVKAGDEVTVNIHPLRSGNNGGQLLAVELPDGETLGVLGTRPVVQGD